jgi:hypothetical protein
LFAIINTPKNPGALRAPDCFNSLCFYCIFIINTPEIFPARFARRIASYSVVLIAFDHKYLKNLASRKGIWLKATEQA